MAQLSLVCYTRQWTRARAVELSILSYTMTHASSPRLWPATSSSDIAGTIAFLDSRPSALRQRLQPLPVLVHSCWSTCSAAYCLLLCSVAATYIPHRMSIILAKANFAVYIHYQINFFVAMMDKVPCSS